MEIVKNKVKHEPSKAWFGVLSHTESQFQLFHICSKCVPNGPKGIRNWSLRVPLAQKTGRREVYKTRQKTSIRKVRQYVKNVPKKGSPNKCFFCGFSGSGAKGVPGWSQRPPPSTVQGQFLSKVWQKVVREIVFLWCFIGSCPRLSPHAPKCFRDASRCSRTLPEFSSA